MDDLIENLCREAGVEDGFLTEFKKNLLQDEEIRQEFAYYMEHDDFACKARVCGYTVVDILIWQIDHFRAWLDRDTTDTKQNKPKMVLLAFDTMLKMKKAPEKYLPGLQGETGTDQPI